MKVLSEQEVFAKLGSISRSSEYFVMYSSLLNGLVKNPSLMILPIDDHMVHRGDGVFEAFRFCYGAFYDVGSHLKRMRRSADSISLNIPWKDQDICEILKQMAKECPEDSAVVRLYVSRGPGGFTTNPYETIGSQLYIVLTQAKPPSEERYVSGVTAMTSKVHLKADPWHQIKSCNYLPNVLMKKEAKDNDVDFTLSVSDKGYVAEGSTENVAFIINNELVLPSYDYTLRGTTLERVKTLAEENLKEVGLLGVTQQNITQQQAYDCQEMFFVGTTLEVLPVTRFDDKVISGGKAGEFAPRLRQLLQKDMRFNSQFRLEVEK